VNVAFLHRNLVVSISEVDLAMDLSICQSLDDLVLAREGSMILDSVLVELAIIMDDPWECE